MITIEEYKSYKHQTKLLLKKAGLMPVHRDHVKHSLSLFATTTNFSNDADENLKIVSEEIKEIKNWE